MKLHAIIKNTVIAAAAFTTLMAATGCHSIFEDSDCVDSYNLVRLTYDHNMKFADAFGNEVDRVSLLAFDSSTGTLVKRFDVDRSELTSDHELAVEVAPGSYDFLVWGGNHSQHFDIADGEIGKSTISDFHCRLRRDAAGESGEHLEPLFHGLQHVELPYASPSKPNHVTLNLKKNTNTIRVVLQHLSGEPVFAENFEFTITDGNGWLNHDNTLRDNTQLTYRPWFTKSGQIDVNVNPQDPKGAPQASPLTGRASRAVLGASLAEFTVSRLLTQNKPMLTITNKAENRTVLSIPVIDYALLVKGFENDSLDDQEYLDRQDEYNMTFFLDEGGRWVSAVIIINDWRIVRHEGPIE